AAGQRQQEGWVGRCGMWCKPEGVFDLTSEKSPFQAPSSRFRLTCASFPQVRAAGRKGSMDSELEKFKTDIDLRVYAEGQDYQLDRKESWSGSAVMRGPNNGKIIISRKPDGHYAYWSVRNDKDRGTVIDFIANRTGKNLGQIRKELREWTGR